MLVVGLGLAVAQAQSWSVEATGVLVPDPAGFTANGVGSPTVAWDEDIQRYVMFFETRTGAATATCTGGLWSIGAAVSDDGLTWELWPDPVISPTPGTPWACVAAHPDVVWDNGTYHLFFKAEQGLNACVSGTPAWGCNNYSGVAHATVDVELNDPADEIASVQAQIDAIETQRDADMDALAAALADYEADLLASQSEFACAEPLVPGICAPCTSFTVNSPEGGSDSQPFCQEFSFTIPGTVNVTNNASGHVVTLSFTTTSGANVVCEYRKNGGAYKLDSNPAGTLTQRCLAPNNSLGIGSAVTVASSVTIAINNGASTPNAWVTLNATNGGSQTYDGTLFDAFDDLEAELAAYDYDGTLAELGDFQTDLQALLDWFAPFTPADPEKTALENEGQALINQAGLLELNLISWASQLDTLYDELDYWMNYTQSVVANLPSGIAGLINQTFGYPAVMKKGSNWVLLVQKYPHIYRAEAGSPDGPFTLGASPVISAGTVSWAMTEVYDPNLMCSGDPVFPYQVYFGGKTLTGGVFTSGGISDGVSQDTITWLLNTATQYFGWTNVNDFRHFDVLRASDGEYRMWYSEKPGGGANQVSVASTGAYQDDLSTQRVCP